MRGGTLNFHRVPESPRGGVLGNVFLSVCQPAAVLIGCA